MNSVIIYHSFIVIICISYCSLFTQLCLFCVFQVIQLVFKRIDFTKTMLRITGINIDNWIKAKMGMTLLYSIWTLLRLNTIFSSRIKWKRKYHWFLFLPIFYFTNSWKQNFLSVLCSWGLRPAASAIIPCGSRDHFLDHLCSTW